MSDVAVAEQAAEPQAVPSDSAAAPDLSEFHASLPEEIRGHNSLASINDVGALAKSYVHAQSMIGADKVAVPGKWATDEDWEEVYNKLGRPTDAQGYELNVEAGEGAEPDTEMLGWFRDMSHKRGLTQRQAQGILEDYDAYIKDRSTASSAQLESQQREAHESLKRDWGEAYDQRIGMAKEVLLQFGDESLANVDVGNGLLGDNVDVIKMFHKIGAYISERVSEDGMIGPKQTGVMAPDEARSRYNELTKNPGPYWDAAHPEHDWHVQEAQRVM